MRDSDLDRIIWSNFFSCVSGFIMHPGTRGQLNRGKTDKEMLDYCAHFADNMFEHYRSRFK